MKLKISVVDANDKTIGSCELDLNENSQPAGNDHIDDPPMEPEERMTDAQRRYLFRLLAEMGIQGERARETIKEQAGVRDIKEVSKTRASRLIERLRTRIDKVRKQDGKEESHGSP